MLKYRIQAYSRGVRVDRKFTVFTGDEKRRVLGSYFFSSTPASAQSEFYELELLAKKAAHIGLHERFTTSFDNHSGQKLSTVVSDIRSWVEREENG
jgi:hypothetical protein